MIKACLPCLLLFLSGFFVHPLALTAQEHAGYQRAWEKTDSLALEGLPRSAFSEVEKIYERARKEQNSAMLVKAVIHRMLFQSILEEDSFVKVVDGLQEDLDASAFPVKQVLHSLLAETYWNYYKENRYRFFNRSTVADTSLTDFRGWDYRRLLEEVIKHYQLSLEDVHRQQSTSVAILDGVLEGDKTSRSLRPTLYDFLAQRAARFYTTEESNLVPRPENDYFLNNPALFSEAEAFCRLQLQATDSLSLELKGLELLQELTRFHLQDEDASALASLDLQRLAYIHREAELPHKDSLYRQALEQLRDKHAGIPFYTEIACTLARAIIKNNAPQFAIKNGQALFNPEETDSTRYVKAVAICEEAIRRYPESLGAGNCNALLDEIRKKELNVKAETINYPGEPFRLLISYRNLPDVYLRVIKIHRGELDSVRIISRGIRHSGSGKALKILLSRKPVREYYHRLPSTEDHFSHSAEAGIDALPAGHYAIMASETESFRGDSSLLAFTLVQVSALGTFERNRGPLEELYVTDRKTGQPIANAAVLIYRQETKPGKLPEKRLERTLLSDTNGKIAVRLPTRKLYDALVIFKNDTLEAMQNNWIGEERTMSAPEERKNAVFFTDRKVYRPGQTVYFKGFLFRTGEQTRIWPRETTKVSFSEPGGKKIHELYFTSNEFGTFSGSFIIPESSVPGRMLISAEYGRTWVEVAEYKRPTFEVRFEPSDKVFRLNDTAKATGTATSFSGYPVNNAKVVYTVTRHARFQPFRSYFFPPQPPVHIASGVLSTCADGRFEVTFLAKASDTSQTYTYQITADITDHNGETQGGHLAVAIGNQQLEVSMNIGPEVIAGRDSLQYEVSARNLNGETQEAALHLQVYALDPPARPLRTRLWKAPDQFLVNRDSFRELFPYDIYADEGAPESWGRAEKCLEKKLNVDGAGQLRLEQLRKCVPGYYVAELSAVTPKGESGTARYYFRLLKEKPGIARTPEDFITVLSSSGAPGDSAEFLIGPGEPGYVLYEIHSGEDISNQHWIKTSSRQERVRVPIPAAAVTDGLTVQFTLVNANRIYYERHEIEAVLPEKKLEIELLSFRNKTRPGEKEKWTIKISSPDNEQATAEMVATLYDASLDAISKHSWPVYAFNQGRRRYQPYFPWNTGPFIGGSQPITLREGPAPRPSYFRSFEELNDYGYSYYGGRNYSYQRYLQQLDEKKRQEAQLKEWEEAFLQQSQSVKEGTVISGTVTDEAGTPLAGVSISIKGAAFGVTTNFQGKYKIKVPPEGVLTFSFIGFKTQEVTPGSKQQINIRLDSDGTGLEEVVVVGFASQKKQALTGKVAGINVSNSGIRVGGLSTADQDAMAAPPDEDEAGAGSLAGLQDLVPRKNFAETAFFYPHLYTDEEGKVSLEFTMPESITRWRMLGFAHTKDLLQGNIEKELITSKEVSVSANAPRFLRAGDRIVFTAKVVNLTAGSMEGEAHLVLLDALSLEPVNLLQDAALKEFSLEASSTGTVSWEIRVPEGVEALTYRVLASAGAYTDGEEKTIPILPDKVLITESLPLQVGAGETGDFSLKSFAGYGQATARPYRLSLEYTSNPAWYALQSLPYLMEYPYECAEQLFSRYFANMVAARIINSSQRIKAIFSKWKSEGGQALVSTLEKNNELKSALLEETPWVMHAADETERRKRLALLFDLNNMQQRNRMVLEKLAQMQLPDGSFPWFTGMQGNRFITQYILAGMGRLRHMGALDEKASRQNGDMLLDALRLVDKEVAGDFEEMISRHNTTEDLSSKDQLNASIVHFMYMRSFYSHVEPSKTAKKALIFYLEQAEQFWQQHTVYEQGLLALVMHRNGRRETAGKILRSLQERALTSPEKGMYWPENRQGYFWHEAPVETQALLIEAFTEVFAGDSPQRGTETQIATGPETAADQANAPDHLAVTGAKAVEQMKKWLLLNKRTNSWQTTKATVAACYALLLRGSNWLEAPEGTKITLGGSTLDVLKPGLKKEAGTGYLKASWEAAEISTKMEDIRISNAGEQISWGALYWQYFEKPENVPASGEGLSIRKTLYKETLTESGPVLVPLNRDEPLKTGDLLKVRLELSASQDYEFVHLKDLRAAALEPVDILASYRWRDGLGYYQAPRDASVNFFINHLPRGTYVLEYALRVTHTGTFSNGFAQVQCMYAPEFSARSKGQTLSIPRTR